MLLSGFLAAVRKKILIGSDPVIHHHLLEEEEEDDGNRQQQVCSLSRRHSARHLSSMTTAEEERNRSEDDLCITACCPPSTSTNPPRSGVRALSTFVVGNPSQNSDNGLVCCPRGRVQTDCSSSSGYRPAVVGGKKAGLTGTSNGAKTGHLHGTGKDRIQNMLERFGKDPEEPNLDERCCICCVRRASVKVYPCGHQVFCRLCGVSLIQNLLDAKQQIMRCVICRQEVAVLRHQKGGNDSLNEDEKQSSSAALPTCLSSSVDFSKPSSRFIWPWQH